MITYFSYFCACLLFSPLLLHIAYRSCKSDYHTNDDNSNVTKHNRHNKSNQKKKKTKKRKTRKLRKEWEEGEQQQEHRGPDRDSKHGHRIKRMAEELSPSPIFSAPLKPSATAGGPKWRSHFSSLTRGPMNGARCLAFDQGWGTWRSKLGIQKNSLGVARTRSCPTKTRNDGPLAGKQGMRSYSVGQTMSWLGLKSTYRYF